MHGKRAVVEPDRKLTAEELQQRLCDHYRCPLVRAPRTTGRLNLH